MKPVRKRLVRGSFLSIGSMLALPATAFAASGAQDCVSGGVPKALFGAAVSGWGDADQDGIPDLLVGAPGSDLGAPGAGAIFRVSGADGSKSAVCTGSKQGESLGRAVAGLPDIDGDGIPEVLAGKSTTFAVVCSGANGAVLRTHGQFNGVASVAALGDVDADGFVDYGVGSPSHAITAATAIAYSGTNGGILQLALNAYAFGSAVAPAGDVNADGFDDWIATDPAGDGRALVISKPHPLPLHQILGNAGKGENLGSSAGAAGDVDGDGYDDFVLGMPGYQPDAYGAPAGGARLFSGKDAKVLLQVAGSALGGRLGAALCAGVDCDGDGIGDLLLGAPEASAGLGQVQLHAGSDGDLLRQWLGSGPEAGFGSSLAALGDVDQDLAPDFAAGAPGDPVADMGRVCVIRPACAEPEEYGVGCPAVPAPPVLAVTGCATPGGGLALDVHQAPPGAPVFLLLGGGKAEIPLGSGCTLWIDPTNGLIIGPWTVSDAGTLHLALPIPVGAGFEQVALQAAAVAPVPPGFALTNGALIVLQ